MFPCRVEILEIKVERSRHGFGGGTHPPRTARYSLFSAEYLMGRCGWSFGMRSAICNKPVKLRGNFDYHVPNLSLSMEFKLQNPPL
jgi:hypothetical protein